MGLFDSKKENKSIKLVKKLQQQADLEWEKEIQYRREQVLNDEAIAKELQAQLEDEQRESSNNNNNSSPSVSHTSFNSPPPLPNKPREYNSSPMSGSNSSSSNSLPTIQAPSIKPLYGLSSSKPSLPPRNNTTSSSSIPSNYASKKPAKSYLSSETYKPELQFALASPTPSPTTVFYQKTPSITPAKPVPPQVIHSNNAAVSHNASTRISPAIPPQIIDNTSASTGPLVKMTMPEPVNITPTSYMPVPSSVFNRPPIVPTTYSSSHHNEPIVLPLHQSQQHQQHQQHQQQNNNAITTPVVTPYPNYQQQQSNNNENQAPYPNYNASAYSNYPQQRQESSISLPLGANEILQHAQSHYSQQNYSPTAPQQPASAPTTNSFQLPSSPPVLTTNPYFKKRQKPLFSDSVLSLKPDEEQEHEDEDDWDNITSKVKRIATLSDSESEIDYSDMIYDRRNEELDPFADTFAVQVVPAPTLHILDPATMLTRQRSTKIAVEEEEEVKKKVEKIADEEEIRTFEEKQSHETEPFLNFKTPIQQHAFMERPVYQSSPVIFNQPQPDDLVSEDGNVQVFPTNILRAGAPLSMSANNPYAKKQGAVPASDYGYYKDEQQKQTKTLPELPKTTSQEDRHITVASINPDQRVWIRIHPTDTGKNLAERIHIVASYQTRKVTKITTKNGRNIPLDHSPLFDDWHEIISFQEGEAWTVEWVPIEHPYVDIFTEGKEFMKQLKANFRGSLSS